MDHKSECKHKTRILLKEDIGESLSHPYFLLNYIYIDSNFVITKLLFCKFYREKEQI